MLSTLSLDKGLVVVLHFIFFFVLIRFFSRKTDIEIPIRLISAVFILKVIVGLLYNYIHAEVFEGGDPWYRFVDARMLMGLLLEDPKALLGYLFLPESQWNMLVLREYLSELSYPKVYLSEIPIIRMNILANLMTGNSYYGVIPFVAFTVVWISALASKAISSITNSSIIKVFLVLSLVPSVLFFTAGFYKDSFMYISILLLLIGFINLVNDTNFWRALFSIGLASILMLQIRWMDFVLYLPFFILFYFLSKHKEGVFIKFFVLTIAGVSLVCLIDLLIPGIDLFQILYERKTITKSGFVSSNFYSPDWRGEGLGMVRFFPIALVNAFLQPFPWSASSALGLVASLESSLFIVIIVVAFLFRKKVRKATPILCLFFFISLSRGIFNGLFIENAGTMIRHRSEILSFAMLFVIMYGTNWLEKLS